VGRDGVWSACRTSYSDNSYVRETIRRKQREIDLPTGAQKKIVLISSKDKGHSVRSVPPSLSLSLDLWTGFPKPFNKPRKFTGTRYVLGSYGINREVSDCVASRRFASFAAARLPLTRRMVHERYTIVSIGRSFPSWRAGLNALRRNGDRSEKNQIDPPKKSV
jgi:hypothetical protein